MRGLLTVKILIYYNRIYDNRIYYNRKRNIHRKCIL